MAIKFLFITCVSLFFCCLNSSYAQNNNQYPIDGVVLFEYKLSSYIYYPSGTWYVDKEHNKFNFSSTKNSLYFLRYFCEGDRLALSKRSKSNNFLTTGQYFPKKEFKNNEYTLKGGEIYYKKDTSNIIVSFAVKGMGVRYDTLCEDFVNFHNTSSHCPVQSKITTPLIILTKLKSTSPLNSPQEDKLNLTPYEKDSFHVTYCD